MNSNSIKVGAQPKSQAREWAEALVIALILAIFIRTFVVEAYKIPSGSMEDTLLVGDHLLVNKFLYGTHIPFTDMKFFPIRQPRHGDIAVFKFPGDESVDYIKRVIGTPGDVVEVRDKKLFRNGEEQVEPYVVHKNKEILPRSLEARDNFGPITVPDGKLFMMGDNRDRSYDSRYWGFVDINKLEGKAFIIYWSWDDHYTVKWGRIGMVVE